MKDTNNIDWVPTLLLKVKDHNKVSSTRKENDEDPTTHPAAVSATAPLLYTKRVC